MCWRVVKDLYFLYLFDKRGSFNLNGGSPPLILNFPSLTGLKCQWELIIAPVDPEAGFFLVASTIVAADFHTFLTKNLQYNAVKGFQAFWILANMTYFYQPLGYRSSQIEDLWVYSSCFWIRGSCSSFILQQWNIFFTLSSIKRPTSALCHTSVSAVKLTDPQLPHEANLQGR